MLLPIRIQYYQQAKNPVTLPGEDRWVDKWDVCITCHSAESAAGLEKALLQIDVDVLMGCGTSWLKRKPLTDEQIMANDVLRYHFALNGGAGPISKQGRKVIDAIEAAHGIKENT